MAMNFAVFGPKSDCSGKDQKNCMSKLQTHPLVREGAPQQETRHCLRNKKVWSWASNGN
jgi:hypothetical protein